MASASPPQETPPLDSADQVTSSSLDFSPVLDLGLDNQAESQFVNHPDNHAVARWQVFMSTFLTIFLAEMGDKTQIATLLMTAQSHAPWVIFLGASTALFATSLLGVLLGRWLSSRLSPQTLDRSAAIMLLSVAGMLFWEVYQG